MLKQFLEEEHIYLAGLCVIAIGLSLSPALMSIGQIVLMANFLFRPNVLEKLKKAFSNYLYLSVLGLFLLPILGLIHTDNMHDGLAYVRRQLPLLTVPLVAAGSPILSTYRQKIVLWFYILAMLLSTLVSIVVLCYYPFYDGDPRNIAVFVFQIRFGLMISLGICLLAYEGYTNTESGFVYKTIIWGLIGWFIVFLGILGTRSAFMGLFAVGGITMLYFIFAKKNIWLPIALASVFVLGLGVLYKVAPGIQQRTDELVEEYKIMQKGGNANGHSILQRFVYWKIAAGFIAEHPYVGIGTGDVEGAYKQYYEVHPKLFSRSAQLPAHNQFITQTIATGVIGLLFFVFALLYPLWGTRKSYYFPYIAFAIIFIFSCLVDDTIKSQAGCTFFGYFTALYLFTIKSVNS